MDTLILVLRLLALTEILHSSCKIGTRDLPELYACGPWAAPWTLGIHFRQITCAYVTTIKYPIFNTSIIPLFHMITYPVIVDVI